MNTLTVTSNQFDLSSMTETELNELLEAIEKEMETRTTKRLEARQAKRVEAKATEKVVEAKSTEKVVEATPHYNDGRHQKAEIISINKVDTSDVDLSDVDPLLVQKLANIYYRDNGNTIPMLVESTGYVDCEIHYKLVDTGKSKIIYLAAKKAYEMNHKVACMANILQGQCFMLDQDANGLMDVDVATEYDLLLS